MEVRTADARPGDADEHLVAGRLRRGHLLEPQASLAGMQPRGQHHTKWARS